MIFHDIDQRTEEWMQLHVGKVTASGLGQIITPKFKLRDGDMFRTCVYRKAAESFRGKLEYSAHARTTWEMENGIELEGEACGYAAFRYGYKINHYGFCETDDHWCGCSPDGLIGDHSGIELKCPQPHVHVKYLCEGVLPDDYAAQVHGSMFVTGRPEWVFMSYSRSLPAFHLVVKRDEAICEKIGQAVKEFAKAFDAAMHQLKSAA